MTDETPSPNSGIGPDSSASAEAVSTLASTSNTESASTTTTALTTEPTSNALSTATDLKPTTSSTDSKPSSSSVDAVSSTASTSSTNKPTATTTTSTSNNRGGEDNEEVSDNNDNNSTGIPVWVSGIGPAAEDSYIARMLAAIGGLIKWRRLAYADGRTTPGGFAWFRSAADVKRALSILNDLDLDGAAEDVLSHSAAAAAKEKRVNGSSAPPGTVPAGVLSISVDPSFHSKESGGVGDGSGANDAGRGEGLQEEESLARKRVSDCLAAMHDAHRVILSGSTIPARQNVPQVSTTSAVALDSVTSANDVKKEQDGDGDESGTKANSDAAKSEEGAVKVNEEGEDGEVEPMKEVEEDEAASTVPGADDGGKANKDDGDLVPEPKVRRYDVNGLPPPPTWFDRGSEPPPRPYIPRPRVRRRSPPPGAGFHPMMAVEARLRKRLHPSLLTCEPEREWIAFERDMVRQMRHGLKRLEAREGLARDRQAEFDAGPPPDPDDGYVSPDERRKVRWRRFRGRREDREREEADDAADKVAEVREAEEAAEKAKAEAEAKKAEADAEAAELAAFESKKAQERATAEAEAAARQAEYDAIYAEAEGVINDQGTKRGRSDEGGDDGGDSTSRGQERSSKRQRADRGESTTLVGGGGSVLSRIPADRAGLRAVAMPWEALEGSSVVKGRIEAWLSRKMEEYLGDEEPDMVKFIQSKLNARCSPPELATALRAVFDEDADAFVDRLWRVLLFEGISAVEAGSQ